VLFLYTVDWRSKG